MGSGEQKSAGIIAITVAQYWLLASPFSWINSYFFMKYIQQLTAAVGLRFGPIPFF